MIVRDWVRFGGYSDDTARWEDARGTRDSHDDCARGTLRAWRLRAGEHGIIVTVQYLVTGTWMIGLCQIDEETPLPSWPMRWESEDYSVILTVAVPDACTVERVTEVTI